MKRLLILGAGILQIAVIKKAKELGICTIVADGDSNARGLYLADIPLVVNITDPELVYNRIKELHIDGVIHPCSEVAMNTMGYINDKLKLSGIGFDTAMIATNKGRMREAFKQGGAPSPESYSASTYGEFLYKLQLINGKAIVKPSRNSGSRGVSCINTKDNTELLSLYNNAINNSRDKSVVVEKFIEGPEFSVEAIIWNKKINIIAITDKLTTGEPHFIELGHSQPSLFTKNEQQLVIDAAIKGCKSLNLNNCVAHVEIKLQNNLPYIMEIGARLGGDFISTELVHLSTGIDMVRAAIDVALGIPPDLSQKHNPRGAAIRYFVPPEGIISDIDISKCIKDKNIYDYNIYIYNGQHVNAINSSSDRSGHVIATGTNAIEAIKNAENFINNIKYTIS